MKRLINIVSIISVLALILTLAPTAALAQEEVTCDSDVVVQADDWLSKIADKFLGDVLAFPAIVEATNAMAASDDSYAKIDDPRRHRAWLEAVHPQQRSRCGVARS